MTFYTQLFYGEDTVSRNSPAMCTSVCPVSLLAVVVIAWVVHPAPVVCQCTTGHCHDDGDGDNDVSVLTAMVSRLQDTVEQLQRQLHDSNDRQQQLIRDAREELQQLRESSEHQQSILGKQVECMYSLLTSPAIVNKK